MTENERKALLYISVQMDASSTGICRAVFPDRKDELATAGASVAVHLRRKGLVMRGHCQGTWRLTTKGRAALAVAKRFSILNDGPGRWVLADSEDGDFALVYPNRKAAEAAIQQYI